jgi:hypothetical protein
MRDLGKEYAVTMNEAKNAANEARMFLATVRFTQAAPSARAAIDGAKYGDVATILRRSEEMASAEVMMGLCDVCTRVSPLAVVTCCDRLLVAIATRVHDICNTCRAYKHRKMKACSRCKLTWYCNAKCQSADWGVHANTSFVDGGCITKEAAAFMAQQVTPPGAEAAKAGAESKAPGAEAAKAGAESKAPGAEAAKAGPKAPGAAVVKALMAEAAKAIKAGAEPKAAVADKAPTAEAAEAAEADKAAKTGGKTPVARREPAANPAGKARLDGNIAAEFRTRLRGSITVDAVIAKRVAIADGGLDALAALPADQASTAVFIVRQAAIAGLRAVAEMDVVASMAAAANECMRNATRHDYGSLADHGNGAATKLRGQAAAAVATIITNADALKRVVAAVAAVAGIDTDAEMTAAVANAAVTLECPIAQIATVVRADSADEVLAVVAAQIADVVLTKPAMADLVLATTATMDMLPAMTAVTAHARAAANGLRLAADGVATAGKVAAIALYSATAKHDMNIKDTVAALAALHTTTLNIIATSSSDAAALYNSAVKLGNIVYCYLARVAARAPTGDKAGFAVADWGVAAANAEAEVDEKGAAAEEPVADSPLRGGQGC